jgi:hypothetical protein
MTFQEAYSMTSASEPAPHSTGGGFDSWIPLLKNLALVVTILGAIPTAITAYHAWSFGVPFTQVSQRLAQYDLWVKNLDCKIDYKALSTTQGTKVDVGACNKTGDIALKVSAPDGKAAYQWIAYNELQKPGEAAQSSGFIDMLISAARAETPPKSFKVAQALEVKCQALDGKNIVRIVSEGGKCYREIVSPMRGTVDKREEVSCDTSCQ